MPGRQGRLLFAYLAVNRDRVASRDELTEALWPRGLPSAPDPALSALLSKLRRLVPNPRRLIDLSPYRESGYAVLMEALERQGNVAEALRVYERLRSLLREELGAAPSPAVQRMHDRLLTNSVG